MTFTESLLEKAKANPKNVIFPESEEIKVLQCARKLNDLGISSPILAGDPKAIEALAAAEGISLDGVQIVDPEDEALKQDIIREYLALSDMLSEKALNRKLKTPLNLAAAMVKVGRADALAAGIVHTTGDVILAAQMIIGMQEGISTVSSIGIAEIPGFDGSEGNLLAITDCAVNPAPNSEELAEIAIASAATVSSLLGWEPRVAMLTFSTKGSSVHEEIDKVVQAVEIAKQKQPGLKIDGEFQLDAAIVPKVAEKKVKGDSEVAGKANVIVFPNLAAGNIGVKILQIFAHTKAHGPLLQGFAKPVTDFSRSAPVEEMIGNLTMLIVRANSEG
ncbi:MAG: phosphate acyltransferase [Lachnospiraceae bacterium]